MAKTKSEKYVGKPRQTRAMQIIFIIISVLVLLTMVLSLVSK
jgi:predicted nucleic acid-binding Zn ribbon protein